MANKRIKYTLSLSKVIDDHIKRLAIEDDISHPEVIRNSLGLYVYAKDAVLMGGKVQIIDKSGNIKEIVFD